MTTGCPCARPMAGAAKTTTPRPDMNSRRRMRNVIDALLCYPREMQNTCRLSYWTQIQNRENNPMQSKARPQLEAPLPHVAGCEPQSTDLAAGPTSGMADFKRKAGAAA